MQKQFAAAAVAVAVGASSALAYDPQFSQIYVGRDLRQTIPANAAAYANLPNPNYNRLTLLYAHTYVNDPGTVAIESDNNHYHAKSAYTYYGTDTGVTTTVQPYSGTAAGMASNYLPEGGTFGNSPRLQLLPGSGAFAGRYVSGIANTTAADADFGRLTFRSVDTLPGFAAGTPQATLFNSGGNLGVPDPDGAGPLIAPNRWTGAMSGTNLALQVVSITPGLSVAAGNATLTAAGQQYAIGSGGSALDFTPVLYTTANTGNYSVTFRLIDTGTANNGAAFGESGQFTINAVVPEPTSLATLGAAAAGLLRRRRRAEPAGRF